jgi:hypothetical protein
MRGPPPEDRLSRLVELRTLRAGVKVAFRKYQLDGARILIERIGQFRRMGLRARNLRPLRGLDKDREWRLDLD